MSSKKRFTSKAHLGQFKLGRRSNVRISRPVKKQRGYARNSNEDTIANATKSNSMKLEPQADEVSSSAVPAAVMEEEERKEASTSSIIDQ